MKRLLPALLALLATSPAYGFVRTQTSTGTPVAWRDHCPSLRLGGPANPDLPGEPYATLLGSARAWNTPTQNCHNPPLVIEGHTNVDEIGYDGTSVVLWRLHGFCDEAAHKTDEVCTSPNAAAVTTIFYIDKPGDSRDGDLLEADMEINAVDFQFALDGSVDKIDLANTLTHELGHVLGLDHTCYTVPGSAPPTDSSGQQVPHCFPLSALASTVTQAAMFNFESPGEVDKRAPTVEETGGVCTVYANRTEACTGGGGGCSAVPAARALPFGVCILALLLVRLGLGRRAP